MRGEQVSGEYLRPIRRSTADGWFTTRDGGWFDAGGYLYVDGRMDDVIVRGGENLSPGEIEDVLLEHPAVPRGGGRRDPRRRVGGGGRRGRRAARGRGRVRVGALRPRGRSAPIIASPEVVEFRDELPVNDTGKVLRRVLRDELAGVRAVI